MLVYEVAMEHIYRKISLTWNQLRYNTPKYKVIFGITTNNAGVEFVLQQTEFGFEAQFNS